MYLCTNRHANFMAKVSFAGWRWIKMESGLLVE